MITSVFLTLSYALLALAFKRIPVAVAFAVWEAVGLLLVTVAGALVLNESEWKGGAGVDSKGAPIEPVVVDPYLGRCLHLPSHMPQPSPP